MVEKIAQFLSNPKRIPALQELHMLRKGMEHQGLASLHRALSVNKTLRYLQISNPDQYVHHLQVRYQITIDSSSDEDADGSSDEEVQVTDLAVIERYKIEQDCNGELLLSSLQVKVAFLSVLQHETSADKPRNTLDALMVSFVFKFAAGDVRRRITWSRF